MPIDPITLSGIIGAGSTLMSSVINHASSRLLQNNAYRQNVQMWHEQNAYNSPLSQVARLRAAGLNPALAYGASGSVTGSSEAPPQLDYGSTINQPLLSPDSVMNAQNFMAGVATRKLQKLQGEKLDSDIAKNNAETFNIMQNGVITGARAKRAEELAIQELRGMTARNDKTYKECEEIDETVNNLIATRNLTKEQISQLSYLNEYADRTMEARVANASLQPVLTRSQIYKLNEEAGKFGAEIKLIGENFRQMQTINGYLPLTLQTNLFKGFSEISNLQHKDKQIDEACRLISAQTGIAEKQLKTYFLNLVLGQYHQFKSESQRDKQNDNSDILAGAALAGAASKLIPFLF